MSTKRRRTIAERMSLAKLVETDCAFLERLLGRSTEDLQRSSAEGPEDGVSMAPSSDMRLRSAINAEGTSEPSPSRDSVVTVAPRVRRPRASQ